MKKKLLALAMAFTVCVMSLSAVFPVISFAATPEVDLSDKTLINYEGVPGVTVTQDGQVEIPAVTANNGMLSITGKRGDVGDFRSVFRLYLPQPSESIAKDQVVFCIIFRNQSTDQENWIGTTWPWYFDAYGLKIMPDGIQLMRGSNIIKLFSWTTLNLFDARQHVLALNCVNEGANVRITLDVDDSNVVNFLDDGSIKQDVFGNSLMDHTNVAVSNPTPLTGNGGFQIFAQNTSAILAKNDIVFEEVVPELTKVDITTGWSTSIAEGTGLVMAENEMSLPNGGTRPDTYDTWNYTLPTEKNLTNYTAKFKLTATPGDSSDPIFRLVVKNAGKMDDIVQMTWPLESYTLEFHKGDYRVLRGANIMHYAGGTTILDGKEHDCELTVYNNDKGGVTIIFSYDGVELIRYVDLGGQTTDFFNGQISGGPLAPVTAIGSMQIDTIDTSVLLKTEKVFDPSTLPKVDFTSSDVLNFAQVEAVTIEDGQVTLPNGASGNGRTEITGKTNDIGNFTTTFNVNLKPGAASSDQIVFGVTFRCKNSDLNTWIGATWPWYFDAYTLKIMPDGLQLMRGSNIIKLFGWSEVNLFDEIQHKLTLHCYDIGDNVKIELYIDNEAEPTINFLDDGSIKTDFAGTPIKDQANNVITNPVPVTGNGSIQLFTMNSQAILSTKDIVIKEEIPELTEVNLTADWDESIFEGTGMTVNGNKLVLPNGKDQADTYSDWNYALPTKKNLTNYQAKFKIKATPGDGDLPILRLVVKNAGNKGDIIQTAWPISSYTLEFQKGDYRVLRGSNIMHYAGGFTLLDGKEHECLLQVYNNEKGGVTIRLTVDGAEAVEYVDFGGQTTDFFGNTIAGAPEGGLQPVTGTSSIQIMTLDTALEIESLSANPAPPLKILFVGNSMTQHGPAPDIGWNGNWGMAASAEDKDYVHQLMKLVKEKVPDADFRAVNVAEFERDFVNYNITQLSQYRNYDADIIVMRACENVVPNSAEEYGFDQYILKLMDYLNPTGDAKIIFTTGFWRTPIVDQQIELAAASRNYPLVKLGHLGDDDTNKAYGLFENQGVAEHPGDKGMLLMAEAIWESLSKILDGEDGHLKMILTNNNVTVEAYKNDIPADTTLKAEIIRDDLLSKANEALAPTQASELYKVSLLSGQTAVEPLDNVIVTLPIPNGANPDSLGVYAVSEDGSVKELAFDIMDNTVVFRTNQTGLFVVGVTPVTEEDGSEIYEDGLVEKSEVPKVLALSTGDKIVFRASDYEGFTLDCTGFAAIRYAGKDIEIRLKGGVMKISKEVFAAITAIYKDLDFKLIKLNDLSAIEGAIKGTKGVKLYEKLGYEISVKRVLDKAENEDGNLSRKTTALSLAYPIKVELPYSGKSLSTNFKMLSIEENGYLTLEKAVLLDGILSFDAYELNLYAGVEAEAGLTEEDINNPNTGTNPLYLLFGIMVCGASAALAIGCTYCKRRRMVR